MKGISHTAGSPTGGGSGGMRPIRSRRDGVPDHGLPIIGHFFFLFFFLPMLGNRFLTAALTFFCSAGVPL
jgi:hypothetical protein